MFRVARAAKLIGVHPNTLRRWEDEGKIKPARTLGGARRYTVEQINQVRAKMGLPLINDKDDKPPP